MATPDTIIANQQSFAFAAATDANAFISALGTLATTTFAVPGISIFLGRAGITDDAEAKLTALRPDRPTLPGISAVAPTPPTFSFSSVIPVEVLDFLGASPLLAFPPAPSSALPTPPAQPTVNDVAIPTAPNVTLPTPPGEQPVPIIPPPPSIEIPFFDGVAPDDDLLVPSNTFSFFEQAYVSALLDETKRKLLSDLEDGGYGIDTNDEEALWERARSREFLGAQQATDEMIRFQAARGFPLPTGDLSIMYERGVQAQQGKLSDVNRDILLDRSDRFVKARQFALTQSKELETVLIGFHNSVMERALNVAKTTLDSGIKIFDALVKRFTARLETFKTTAAVFESRVRAALAQAEIYKAQLDGARLEVDVYRAGVEAYSAQIAGIQAILGLFRTRMEAASIQSQIERTRLEAFRGLVDAFGQQVQAKVAEFNMYRAQVDGEKAKADAFRSEVEAYTARVQGAKAKADVQIANLNAETEQARTQLAAYQAQIAQFQADLQAQVETLKAVTDIYRADISSFATSADALKAAFQLQIQEQETENQVFLKAVDATVAVTKLNLDALVAAADVRVKSTVAGANVYANLASGALSAITGLAATIVSSTAP